MARRFRQTKRFQKKYINLLARKHFRASVIYVMIKWCQRNGLPAICLAVASFGVVLITMESKTTPVSRQSNRKPEKRSSDQPMFFDGDQLPNQNFPMESSRKDDLRPSIRKQQSALKSVSDLQTIDRPEKFISPISGNRRQNTATRLADKAIEDQQIPEPVVLQAPRPISTMLFSPSTHSPLIKTEEVALLGALSGEFEKEIESLAANDPEDPVYFDYWRSAQRRSDERLRMMVGKDRFNQLTAIARQQAQD